jgi:hypothetical protein
MNIAANLLSNGLELVYYDGVKSYHSEFMLDKDYS